MHYVRFLKPPTISTLHGKPQLKLLFTIQTDLGDDFYPCDLDLLLTLWKQDPDKGAEKLLTKNVSWKATNRQVSISEPVPRWRASPLEVVQLSLGPERSPCYRLLLPASSSGGSHIALPPIIGADSLPWRVRDGEAPKDLLRRFKPQQRQELTIREEAGHSIERHVWDAGLAAVACIDLAFTLGRKDSGSTSSFLPSLVRLASRVDCPSVVELGAGVGIVGCEIARASPGSRVILTDLPEARSIAECNISQIASHDSDSRIRTPEFQCLDWTKRVPSHLREIKVDLIVATDCIYNPDYSPDLVNTIEALAESSPDALIMIASKTRHESEAIFFDKMASARFTVIEHELVLAPVDHSEEALQDCEMIDIYIFSRLSQTAVP